MSQFVVGQKVVYVGGNRFRPGEEDKEPSRQAVYTVSWIGDLNGKSKLDLAELPFPESEIYHRGYAASCFRPVVEPKAEVSFTMGAPLDSEKWDNRRVKEPVR